MPRNQEFKPIRPKRLNALRAGMAVVLLCLAAALALGGWLVYRTTQEQKAKAAASSSTMAVSSQNGALPVYPNSWSLTVVSPSKKLPDSFKPQLTAFRNVQVDARIVPALQKMLDDAKTAGYDLALSSGYVDANAQQSLYEQKVQALMQAGSTRTLAETNAAAQVPKGGYSENQTGMAVEFSRDAAFANSDASHWLANNCVQYGFVRRYTEDLKSTTGMADDPAHYRYVGTDHARAMRRLGLSLESYVRYLAQQDN